jgi:DNA-binding MarR family transcriptional regulator
MSTSEKSNLIKNLGLPSYEMSTSITLAQRAFGQLLKTCLGHHGLTIPQWTLLGQLYKSGPMRPISASQLLGIKPPYVAKLINELEVQGILTTVLFDDDGRGKSIMLTVKGEELIAEVEVKLEKCINEQLKGLEQADLETYFRLSKYIASNVKHKN